MAVMRGVNSFLVVRYIAFGLFTICNAITCSVAVWNYSIVLYTQPAQVDVYLIFLGAFSLLSIFTLIFVELLWVNALTTRVWFECAWVALFWLMELAGAAALIAIESDLACSGPNTTFLNALCTSDRVLLVFTWMCSVMLLVYLLTLVFIAASRHVEEPKIWVSDVRSLRAAAVRQSSPSIPNSPLTARFKKRPSVDIYTPHHPRYCPVQPLPHHMALSTDYEIEPFHPVFAAPEQMDIPHASDLPEAIPLPHAPIIPSFTKPIPPLPPKETRNARSLLPQFDMRPEPVSSVQHPSSGRPSRPMPAQSNSIPLPLPLGDWPRQDVMQLPAKLKRKPRPPSAFEFPRRHLVTTDRACVPADTTNTSVTQPRPRRPSGPRQRIPSGDAGYRPAPQDLYPFSVGRRDT